MESLPLPVLLTIGVVAMIALDISRRRFL